MKKATIILAGTLALLTAPPAKMAECTAAGSFCRAGSAAEAAEVLKQNLQSGDRVLLKASRGERLEQVLEFFREN